jgi:TolA-binding protein
LLTKHKYLLALVVVALAFPAAAAFARTGGSGPVAIGNAEVALAPLQRPVDHFEQMIRDAAKQIRANQRAAARKEQREKFAHLPGGVSIETLESIASCESGGDPTIVSSGGSYRGKYQFDYGTWESVGGHGDPAAAPEAEQDYRAALLYSRSGSSPWPVCG